MERKEGVEAMSYEEIEVNILRSMDALGTKPEDSAEMIQRVLAKKAQQRAECGDSSKSIKVGYSGGRASGRRHESLTL